MRQIVLDTETTGLNPQDGHRIIEIGCVEMVNRRLTGNRYHQYLQPDRSIDEGAIEVHGITNEKLQDMPRFEEIANDFVNFIRDAELIIHNAPFDIGFIDSELSRLGKNWQQTTAYCTVIDTLPMARQLHPGQKNTLDALCKRYAVDNSQRELHGALLDAELLADVYLAMTGGQVSMALGGQADKQNSLHQEVIRRLPADRKPLKVIHADDQELQLHRQRLEKIGKACGGESVWVKLETT